MKVARLCAGVSLSVVVSLALGAGCAGDDRKVVPRDGGAGGQGGEGLGGDGPASGGSQNSGGSSGSSAGGAAGEGAGLSGASGTGDGGTGGGTGGSAAGEGGGNLAEAGAPAGGNTSNGEGGVGGVATSEPTPVPSSCVGCASDFCVATRSACQNDATCVACRDEDYTAPACGQNAAFTAWIACICATGCAGACASVCP